MIIICKLKSGIILKGDVYVPDHDHHTTMLENLGIADTKQNAETLFVRAELVPANDDVFSPIEDWKFVVDQDITPDWFVSDYEKTRMFKAVKAWAKEHIRIDESDFSIGEGTYYLKNCKMVACNSSTVTACDNSTVKAWGNSTVKAWGNSTVKACDNSTVEACDNSTVEACDNSTVEAYDNSTVEAYDNSTVKAWGNSTVKAWGNAIAFIPERSWVKRESVVLMENSTLKDCNTKTIYQSGDWKLVAVEN